jgi:hypothetical protein
MRRRLAILLELTCYALLLPVGAGVAFVFSLVVIKAGFKAPLSPILTYAATIVVTFSLLPLYQRLINFLVKRVAGR